MMDTMMTSKAITLEANRSGRDFVCGDIHGEYTELMQQLTCAGFDFEKDRLFALGDVIDRGWESYRCLKLFRRKWFYSILGNHEQVMINVMDNWETKEMWYAWHGEWFSHLTPSERRDAAEIAERYLSILPYAITLDFGEFKVGMVHADPPTDWNLINQPLKARGYDDYRLWGRNRIDNAYKKPVTNIDLVFVGHTPNSKPKQLGNVVYLDTGSGHPGGYLTLVEVKTYAAIRL